MGAGWPTHSQMIKCGILKQNKKTKKIIEGLESRTFYVSKLSATAKL